MLFLVSAPSRRKTDKVVIGYPDFPDIDSPLFFALIVDFEYGVRIDWQAILFSYLSISPLKFTLGFLCISLHSYFDHGRLRNFFFLGGLRLLVTKIIFSVKIFTSATAQPVESVFKSH